MSEFNCPNAPGACFCTGECMKSEKDLLHDKINAIRIETRGLYKGLAEIEDKITVNDDKIEELKKELFK